jgi:hypothetical protein
MPKFYRQNKKRIDPRYFLHETIDRDYEISDDESVSDEADELEDIASSLRTYEKDLTGRKGSFLSDEELAMMSREELINFIKTEMDTSPEAHDLRAHFQSEDDREMGHQEEHPEDMMVKQSGHGRGLREEVK